MKARPLQRHTATCKSRNLACDWLHLNLPRCSILVDTIFYAAASQSDALNSGIVSCSTLRFCLCLAALSVFEHVITLDREIELFWKRKFSGAAVLFLMNRFIRLMYIVLESDTGLQGLDAVQDVTEMGTTAEREKMFVLRRNLKRD